MTIYSDGACSLKRHIGAYGIYVPATKYKLCQVVNDITNNEAEMLGFIAALRYAQDWCATMHLPKEQITIVSDSMYCVGGYDEWMYNWHIPTRKNAYLWQAVWDLKEVQGAKFTIRHCRGHGKGENDLPEDVEANDIIDKLVAGSIKGLTGSPTKP